MALTDYLKSAYDLTRKTTSLLSPALPPLPSFGTVEKVADTFSTPMAETNPERTSLTSTTQTFLPSSPANYTPPPTNVPAPTQQATITPTTTQPYVPPQTTAQATAPATTTVYKDGQAKTISSNDLRVYLDSGYSQTAPTAQAPAQTAQVAGQAQPAPTQTAIQPAQTAIQPAQTQTQTPTQDIYSKYGLTAPTAPTLPQQGDYIKEYGLTAEQIQANLERQKQAIRQKWDLEREQVKTQTENERMANLSGLYSMGEVNPLSSGTASIGSQSTEALDRRMRAIDQAQFAEEQAAERQAYGEKENAAGMRANYQREESQRIQQQYELNRTQLDDTINLIQFGRKITNEDKALAQDNFRNLLELGGSEAFTGYGIEELSAMDKASGYKEGTTANILTRIKEMELKGESNIEKLPDGSIVNWKQDKNGEWSYTTLVKAPEGQFEPPKVEKMGDNYFQFNPNTGEWENIDTGVSSGSDPNEINTKIEQLNLVNTAITNAEKFADAAGRSKWGEAIARGIFGATDFTKLESYADTIKTTMLTMAGDPDIKKFFGPQMSEADVRMMMAGGTTLDPARQGPEEFKEELARVKDLINRMSGAVSTGVSSNQQYDQGDVEYLMNTYGITEEEALSQLGFLSP